MKTLTLSDLSTAQREYEDAKRTLELRLREEMQKELSKLEAARDAIAYTLSAQGISTRKIAMEGIGHVGTDLARKAIANGEKLAQDLLRAEGATAGLSLPAGTLGVTRMRWTNKAEGLFEVMLGAVEYQRALSEGVDMEETATAEFAAVGMTVEPVKDSFGIPAVWLFYRDPAFVSTLTDWAQANA